MSSSWVFCGCNKLLKRALLQKTQTRFSFIPRRMIGCNKKCLSINPPESVAWSLSSSWVFGAVADFSNEPFFQRLRCVSIRLRLKLIFHTQMRLFREERFGVIRNVTVLEEIRDRNRLYNLKTKLMLYFNFFLIICYILPMEINF